LEAAIIGGLLFTLRGYFRYNQILKEGRMMPRLIFTNLCIACIAVSACFLPAIASPDGLATAKTAREATTWTITPSFSRLAGDTRYELNANSPDPRDTDQLVPIRSELVFPLDTTLLGLAVNWSPGQPDTRRWTLAAEFRTNVSDPSDPMTDGDWVDNIQVGYTESPAELDLIHGALEIAYGLRPGPRSSWSLLARLDYQRIEQHLVGYQGWRRSLFSDTIFPTAGTAPVIDYRVTYLTPQLGGRFIFGGNGHLQAGLQATAGLALASDEDDHLLRGRLSEGEGVGFAAQGRLTVDLLPGFVSWRWLTVGLVGDVRFQHAEGEVTQTWYRNEDQPEGTVIADIPYTIESLQYEVGLRIGVAF
jgi:hypothetical protein